MDRSFEIENDKLLAGLSYTQGFDDETLFAGVRADVLAKSSSNALSIPGHEGAVSKSRIFLSVGGNVGLCYTFAQIHRENSI